MLSNMVYHFLYELPTLRMCIGHPWMDDEKNWQAGKIGFRFSYIMYNSNISFFIISAVFLFCWVPFFTCNMLNAICIKFNLGWYPGDTAFIFTTWLGYINSCINPLIYTIFNPEFRKAFKKLLNISWRRKHL